MKIIVKIPFSGEVPVRKAAQAAAAAGAHGVLLVARRREEPATLLSAIRLKRSMPEMMWGVRVDYVGQLSAWHAAAYGRLDFMWSAILGDRPLHGVADALRELYESYPDFIAFASVDEGQLTHYPSLRAAAEAARSIGCRFAAHGEAPGWPPDLEDIEDIAPLFCHELAISEGLDASNLGLYAPYASHAFVEQDLLNQAAGLQCIRDLHQTV